MIAMRTAFEVKTRLGSRSSVALAREFQRTEALPPEQIDALRARRSIDHARFAMENSPFYAELYRAAGFTVSDLTDPAAFTSLPLVEKHMVREHFDRIKTPEATEKTSVASTTGGSTGQPLRILRDLRFPARALEWRLFRWWGVNPWDHRGNVYRHILVGDALKRHDRQWWPSKRIQLDAFSMTDAAVREFVREWNALRPTFLFGYVGGVLELARTVERLGLAFSPPHAIGVTAAALPEPVRREIQEILSAPVYDHYRAAEMPWMAGECGQRDGLHVFDDVRSLEILDDQGNAAGFGAQGEIVATDLTNRVFPLIRYRMGDISRRLESGCPCGVNLSRISPVLGRVVETVRIPGGGSIAGESLTGLFSRTPTAVRQFQLAQAADYSVTVRCVVGNDPDAILHIQEAVRRVHDTAGGKLQVGYELVDAIAHVGGKTRFILSEAPAAGSAS